MRSLLGQVQERTSVPVSPDTGTPAAPTSKVIPYDYVARFVLTGVRGNRVQDVVSISIDGPFVAVTVGYSFIPAPEKSSAGNDRAIDFKYSIVDSGSGRELQNRPIHNIAGLGEPNGDRPFRPLPKPMVFMPRSTIRIEVEEISEGPCTRARNSTSCCTATKCSATGRRCHERMSHLRHSRRMPDSSTSRRSRLRRALGQENVLARYELHRNYCGMLLYFAQFTDRYARDATKVQTPGLAVADPLQRPAARSVSHVRPDHQSVGIVGLPDLSAARRGVHPGVCCQTSGRRSRQTLDESRRTPPRPLLV